MIPMIYKFFFYYSASFLKIFSFSQDGQIVLYPAPSKHFYLLNYPGLLKITWILKKKSTEWCIITLTQVRENELFIKGESFSSDEIKYLPLSSRP